MPEMTFSVTWPDGGRAEYYSPSLVVHDHLEAGRSYAVDDFVARAARAMGEASERVRARYGIACTSAMATEAEVRTAADAFAGTDPVVVTRLHPPLPTPPTRTSAAEGEPS